jgi:hypothetical protein
MDFQLTEEQQMIVESLGKYARNELDPVSREYRDLLIPKEKMRDIQQRLLDFGVGVGRRNSAAGGWTRSPWVCCSSKWPRCRRISPSPA